MECTDAYNLSSPLGSGPWFVSGVFAELDEPGEYFFDAAARKLYVFYNESAGTPPPADWQLAASQLEVFFNASGTPDAPVRDMTWAGLGFRDQRHGQLERWVDPSGGACRVAARAAAQAPPPRAPSSPGEGFILLCPFRRAPSPQATGGCAAPAPSTSRGRSARP